VISCASWAMERTTVSSISTTPIGARHQVVPADRRQVGTPDLDLLQRPFDSAKLDVVIHTPAFTAVDDLPPTPSTCTARASCKAKDASRNCSKLPGLLGHRGSSALGVTISSASFYSEPNGESRCAW
jgi:hypothetical protein